MSGQVELSRTYEDQSSGLTIGKHWWSLFRPSTRISNAMSWMKRRTILFLQRPAKLDTWS